MNKTGQKNSFVISLRSILFASLAATNHGVKADSTDLIYLSSGVILFSPLNRTYNSNILTLNFTLACGFGIKYSLNYSIDGKYKGPMPYVVENAEELHVVYDAHELVKLPKLPEGSHSLTVYLETSGLVAHKSSYADTVHFAVDTTPPNVSIRSPINKTYTAANTTTTKIPLDAILSENVSQVVFTLDDEENTSISGNTTLTGLSLGPHNVTLYAQDLAGNTASETVNFAMAAEPEPQTALDAFQPTTLVAVASGTSTATITIAFLLYFRKRTRV